MSRYLVSPSEAYKRGGSPRGELYRKGGRTCPLCGEVTSYYSVAGLREMNITGYCEPCYDYSCIAPDDMEERDRWIMGVMRA